MRPRLTIKDPAWAGIISRLRRLNVQADQLGRETDALLRFVRQLPVPLPGQDGAK
ncbi:MAG: hypothetical protein H0X38_05650 [Planctomycetes bacterium]|nr:hypothetical protein [Planctomycetota bacterium]